MHTEHSAARHTAAAERVNARVRVLTTLLYIHSRTAVGCGVLCAVRVCVVEWLMLAECSLVSVWFAFATCWRVGVGSNCFKASRRPASRVVSAMPRSAATSLLNVIGASMHKNNAANAAAACVQRPDYLANLHVLAARARACRAENGN